MAQHCTFCGSPKAGMFAGFDFPRCDHHSATPTPAQFRGQNPEQVLAKIRSVPPVVRHNCPLGEVKLSADLAELKLGETSFRVVDRRGLAKALNLPTAYFFGDAVHTVKLRQLMVENQLRLYRDAVFELRAQDGKIIELGRACSSGVDAVSPVAVLEEAFTVFREEGMFHDRLVEEYAIGPAHSFFQLLTRINQSPPRRVGDSVAAGVAIHLNGKIVVRPFLRRLVCTNGLIASSSSGYDVTTQSAKSLASQVREALKFSITSFLGDFVRSDEVLVADPLRAVEHVFRDRAIPRDLRARLRRSLQVGDEHPLTAFELANLVTVLGAQHREASFRLGEHGARVVDENIHTKVCRACGQQVGG